MASAELQSKLKRRLQLQREAVSPSAQSRGYWQPPKIVEVGTSENMTPEEADLRDRIRFILLEADEAKREKERMEAAAVSQGIELGAEVARLRIDVEVLRRDLTSAQNEVHHLRGGACIEKRRERALQEQASRVNTMLSAAEARRSALRSEAETTLQEEESLVQKVKSLEDEVHEQVAGRLRLEALLRASEARECELRRLLKTAKVDGRVSTGSGMQFCNTTSIANDSDDEVDDDVAGHNDLEFSYEGLELSGFMPLDRALQLARARSGHRCEPVDHGKTELEGDGANMGEDHSRYEAPLRELELALARLLGGSSEAGTGSVEGAPIQDATGGTGEIPNSHIYEMKLKELQETLGRLAKPAAGPGKPDGPDAEPVSPEDDNRSLQKLKHTPGNELPSFQGEESQTRLPPSFTTFGGLFLSPYALSWRRILLGGEISTN